MQHDEEDYNDENEGKAIYFEEEIGNVHTSTEFQRCNFVGKVYALRTKKRLLASNLLADMTEKKFELVYWESM